MAIRGGMADNINHVRRLVNDASATVWTEQQVQDTLDRYRQDVWGEQLGPRPIHSGGTTVYLDYVLASADAEGTASGSGYWRLYDSNGADATGYTLYADRGLVRFAADQAGSARWADYRTYDVHLAAADLWDERAGQLAGRYDFGTGSDRFTASQWFDHCYRMAQQMRARGRSRVVPMPRGDVNP